MTAPGEKIDPGHWVGLCGGALMFLVVLLVSMGLMMPWWTEHKELLGSEEDTEVSLWTLYTRTVLSADATEDCTAQCDFTKVGTSKVRENTIGWSDLCLEASPENKGNCQQIWILRVGAMLCWFLALMSTALATFNFCGAGLPASIRCAPTIKVALGVGCVIGSALALCVASIMDVRYQPTPPGTAPRDHPAPGKVELNGVGFVCLLISCIASIIGSGIAYLAQQVIDHMPVDRQVIHPDPDEEQGSLPLAEVKRGKAPNLFHQVQQPKHVEIKIFRESSRASRQSSKRWVAGWESGDVKPQPTDSRASIHPSSKPSYPAPVKVGAAHNRGRRDHHAGSSARFF